MAHNISVTIEGLHLCVMEYVPGKTLAEKLDRVGRLPIDQIERLFQQIAGAIEYAHHRGIVHRDLKPSNVQVTRNGDAKVLDFGLASVDELNLGRDHVDLTTASGNDVLRMAGTIPYMSPAQIRGRSVDKRTDVWAFGCCLFEALTGRRAFHGESLADSISAILDKPPDWDAIPDAAPRGMRLVMKRSLEKDPERRLRDIGDAWLSEDVIQDLRESDLIPSSSDVNTWNRSPDGINQQWKVLRSWRSAIPWLLAALALIGCLFAWSRSPDPPSRPSVGYELTLPANQHLALDLYGPLGEPRRSIAVSPDGVLLAYIAVESGMRTGTPRIFIKRLGGFEVAKPIAETDGAYHVFFSPDSRWIGFFANGWLKKVTTAGSSPVDLCEVSFPFGGTWSDDGNIYIGDYFGDRLVTINENGGQSSTVKSEWRDKEYQWIEALPDGRGLLASRRAAGVTRIDAHSGQKQILLPLEHDVHPFYSAGRL
jgi:hypothetical protein